MQHDLQQHYLPLGIVSCYEHAHIHSHIFIKCYLIHLEKACFLGFLWEFNHGLKLLQLGNTERTFRKYFIVLCKSHVLERFSDEFPMLTKATWGHVSWSHIPSPTVSLLPNSSDRQHLMLFSLRLHRRCSLVHLVFSTNLHTAHPLSPMGKGKSTTYVHGEQAMKRKRCGQCKGSAYKIPIFILCL